MINTHFSILSLYKIRNLCAMLMLLALAGCTSWPSSLDIFKGEKTAKENASAPAPLDRRHDSSAYAPVRPYCPSMRLSREGGKISRYLSPSRQEPDSLIFQANIEKWSRNCLREDNGTSLTFGIQGRITPGPAWRENGHDLKVGLEIKRADEPENPTFVKKSYPVQTDISAGGLTKIWTLIGKDIILPADREFIISIGLIR